MIEKTINIKVDISTDELCQEIKLCGPLDLMFVLNAVAETITDEDIKALCDFFTPSASTSLRGVITTINDFAMRIQKIIEDR